MIMHFLSLFLFFLTFPSVIQGTVSVPSPSPNSPLPISLTPPPSPAAACKYTLYPKLCRSMLSAFQSSSPSADPYDCGRFIIKESKKQAKRTSNHIRHVLSKKQQFSMSQVEEGALEDCLELFEDTVDYLEKIANELVSADSMSESLVERVESMLSAIVTNQQTCLDGLDSAGSSFMTVLKAPLSSSTQLSSISLRLVTQALNRNSKNRKRKGSGRKPQGGGDRFFINYANSDWPNRFGSGPDFKKGRILADEPGSINGDESDNGSGVLLRETVTVAQDGSKNFTTIGDAIAFAPNDTLAEDGYFMIYVMEGIYEEYVVVPKNKKYVMLLGDGINRTVITGNRSFVEGWTTYNTSTFAVKGDGFIAIDITFRNTAGPEKHQAVAMRNNADLSTFYRCSFEGYQDTLYAHSLRQFYRDCDIYGTIDFIFGNSASVFQNCNIIVRKPMYKQKNTVTAQGRTIPDQNTGFSIHNCTIRAAPDFTDFNSSKTFLGRPWKEFSRTVIMQSFIDDMIDPSGWLAWNGTFGLDTLYYGEFDNHGPGAITDMRVHWPGYSLMNVSQAVNFTVYNFTMGDTWLPFTDIPFNNGLL